MANNLQAFTPVKFVQQTVDVLYNETIYNQIANTKYEGEIKKSGDRVRIRTAGRITMKDYTKGMTLVAEDLAPTDEDLIIDQAKYFKFVVDDIDEIQNDINAINEYADNAKMDMSEVLDADLLSYGRKNVHGLNALGTDYSTGTVEVAATTGVVTGTGTTFTAAMVGGYFSADGGVTHQLVTGFTSATSITVTDLDGEGYTAGAVTAGASFVIRAATAIALTKTNVYQYLVMLNVVLNQRLTSRKHERFLAINAEFEGLIKLAPEFQPAIESAHRDIIKQGVVGFMAGFKMVFSELIDGNNTTGYWFIAGTKDFMSFAQQIMKVSVVPSEMDPNSFVDTCKGLLVWGRKVCEGNRGRGAVLRATVSLS